MSYEEINSGEELETHSRTLSFEGVELTVWQNTDLDFEDYGPSYLAAEYEYLNGEGESEYLILQMYLSLRPDGPRGQCHMQAVEGFEDAFFSLRANPDTSLTF